MLRSSPDISPGISSAVGPRAGPTRGVTSRDSGSWSGVEGLSTFEDFSYQRSDSSSMEKIL